MKNKLSPKWLVYGKNDQKCFVYKCTSPIWSHWMEKITKMFFNKLYQSIYVPISQHISQVYPKYVPTEPKCEFIWTKMIFRPLFNEIENPIWLPKQDG